MHSHEIPRLSELSSAPCEAQARPLKTLAIQATAKRARTPDPFGFLEADTWTARGCSLIPKRYG